MPAQRRPRFKDYVMNESSSNSSSRCLGLLFALFLLSTSNTLFSIRQELFLVGQKFDVVEAIVASLAVLGFISYYEQCEICQDPEADACAEKYDSMSQEDIINAVIEQNYTKDDNDCLYLVLGANPDDLNLCTEVEIQKQFHKETDTDKCGINTPNMQGCAAGFLQPFEDRDGSGPAEPCPTGYWCPKGFVCKIPCPYGSYCAQSTLSADGKKCHYLHGVTPGRDPVDIYNVSQTCASSSDDALTQDDDTNAPVYTSVCPGAAGVGLCPAGYYCPTSLTMFKCPAGDYCPRGTYKPPKCGFGKLTCPKPGEAYPSIFVPIGILLALFFGVVAGSYLAASSIIARKRRARRAAQAAQVQVRREKRKHLEDSMFSMSMIASEVEFQKKAGESRSEDSESSEMLDVSTHSGGDYSESSRADGSGGGGEIDTEDAAAGVEVNAFAQRLTVWLCCGCDVESHVVILVASVVLVGAATMVLNLTDLSAPIFGESVRYGMVLLFAAFSTFVISAFGVVYLSGRDAQPGFNPVQKRRTMEATSAFAKAASDLAERTQDVSLLGSIQDKTDTRINLEVVKLGLKLKSNDAVVLAGVDGRLDAGSVTAIMGPSGAGKTTFMNTLAGRASYGTTTGKVLINGQENSVFSVSRLVGFVPQEDTMHRELTVREILKAYAVMRLPRYFDTKTIERVVQDVIEALQLDHVSDSIIGDEAKRGISGGQRKRVNVGMEMVADPSLLFLDEPTSGLDSTTSFDLVFALGALAKKGVNVITVLHQPSFPLYQMFTNVLLLGKGGRTVFLGKSEDALPYFQNCGYSMPAFVNPADFFMDVIAGKYPRTYQGQVMESDKPDVLFKLWRKKRVAYANERLWKGQGNYRKKTLTEEAVEAPRGPSESFFDRDSAGPESLKEGLRMTMAEVESNKVINKNVKPIDAKAYALLRPAGFFRCLVVCTKRAATQHARAMDLNVFDVLLHAGTGTFLGAANGVVDMKSLAQTMLMYSLGLGMTVGLASLRVFGNERIVFWREASPGAGMNLSPAPYFIGKNLVELPRLFILTFCLAGCFYPFVQSLCDYDMFFGMSLMASWHVSGWAQFLSITYNEKSAQLMLVILCLVNLLYAGVQTRLSTIQDNPLTYGLSWISPNRWLVEDLFICHAQALSAVYRLPPTWYVTSTDSLLGFLIGLSFTERFEVAQGAPGEHAKDPVQWNVLVNFWFGVLTRFMAFMSLNYSNRSQMVKPPLVEAFLKSLNGFLQVCWPNSDIGGDALKAKRSFKGGLASVRYFFGLDQANDEDESRPKAAMAFVRRVSAFTMRRGANSNHVSLAAKTLSGDSDDVVTGGATTGGVVFGGGGGSGGGGGGGGGGGPGKPRSSQKKGIQFQLDTPADKDSVLAHAEVSDLDSLRGRGDTIQPEFGDTYMGAAEEGRHSSSINPMARSPLPPGIMDGTEV